MKLFTDAEHRIPVAGDAETGYTVYIHLRHCLLAGQSVWRNGQVELVSDDVRWLRGRLALCACEFYDRTTVPDSNPDIISPHLLTVSAGKDARLSIYRQNVYELAVAVISMYGTQVINGAGFLPNGVELAKKYCCGTLPHYALYLFSRKTHADKFVNETKHSILLT